MLVVFYQIYPFAGLALLAIRNCVTKEVIPFSDGNLIYLLQCMQKQICSVFDVAFFFGEGKFDSFLEAEEVCQLLTGQ